VSTATADTIQQRADEVVEEFALFDDWMDRYEHLIEQGKALPPLEAAEQTEDNRIRGCQANVWLVAEGEAARVRYRADSDALITKGLIALLVRVLDGQPPAAVATADLGFLDRIGMREHLSPTRKNGLASMVRQMQLEAARLA
jgi:cysteine desulfuration protein SufE